MTTSIAITVIMKNIIINTVVASCKCFLVATGHQVLSSRKCGRKTNRGGPKYFIILWIFLVLLKSGKSRQTISYHHFWQPASTKGGCISDDRPFNLLHH